RRSGPPRRCRVPQAVFEIADQARRPQPLRPQRADRDRQLRRCDARARGYPAVRRSLRTRAWRCRVGAGPPVGSRTAGDVSRAAPRPGGGAAGRGGVDGSAATGRLMTTLVCIGLGYCALHYLSEFGARFDRVVGTTRSAQRAAMLGQERLAGRVPEMLLFDGSPPLRELRVAISDVDALLVSAAPTEGRDPVLALLGHEIALAPRLKSVVYLSRLGVYGDSGGAWIDETTQAIPARACRGRKRIDAELEWQALGARRKVPVAILRLGGIYGPGRNAMVRLLRGTVHRLSKPRHVSNPVHVSAIPPAIHAAVAPGPGGIFTLWHHYPA